MLVLSLESHGPRLADVDSVKEAMRRAADTHARIFQSYNLPYDAPPGSVMDRAMKLWRKKQSRK